MKLIIGLGNPGKEYQNTRHNVGFMVLDNYLKNVNWKEKYNSLYFEIIENEEKIIFLKPQTFMNLSGNSVLNFVNFYKIDIKDILVISDDLDMELGSFKIKTNSSAGGHNGLKSIISCLNTENFYRLKIGISHDKNTDTKDYVLGNFSKKELEILEGVINFSKEVIDCFIKNGEIGLKKDFLDLYSKKIKGEKDELS